jgi:hypothetical protein
MSTDPREPDRAEAGRERAERDRDDPPARREKKPKQPPLTQREVFDLLLRDPAVRPYLYAALGALALVFLVMFDNGSDIGAVLVALLGMANLLFRWVSGPPFLLFVISWFALFPFGIPEAEFADPRKIPDNYFRIADLVLVLAALVYMRCAYRIFGLIHIAMPLENVYPRAEDAPPRRPPSHVSPTELVWMLGTAVALALLGQGAWWVVNNVEFFPASGEFPFRWADPDARRFLRRAPLENGEFTPGQTRFFVSLFVLFFGYLLLRLVFGYWRLRSMSAAEAAAVCTDTAWAETHRERVRLEKWRLWRIQQALERERAAKRAEREAKKREEAKAREEERRKVQAAREAERRRETAERRRRREEEDDEDDDRPRRRRRYEDDDDDDRPRRRR